MLKRQRIQTVCVLNPPVGEAARQQHFTHSTRVLQVPNPAVPLWQAPPAAASAPLSGPLHHRGSVLQEDHWQRPHHQAPLGHVQVQRHISLKTETTVTQAKRTRRGRPSTECSNRTEWSTRRLFFRREQSPPRPLLQVSFSPLGSNWDLWTPAESKTDSTTFTP